MGHEDSHVKPIGLNKKKKNKKNLLAETEPNLFVVDEKKKKSKSPEQKRSVKGKRSRSESSEADQCNIEDEDEAIREKNEGKLVRKKKRKNHNISTSEIGQVHEAHQEAVDGSEEQIGALTAGEKNDRKSKKKRRKTEKTTKVRIDEVSVLHNKVKEGSKEGKGMMEKARNTRYDHLSTRNEKNLLEQSGEPEQYKVYEISSGDEDFSRGMKKWITEYHDSRPGLKKLQERIDDFITDYEAREDQARKEREALAAEGGWTVVVHHKGRKKTTETESGVTVGSVSQAAVRENMDKKKKKSNEVGTDFYRFQKREAQRNEIMALQSKFEQDRKRIQQLRAARKFRPY